MLSGFYSQPMAFVFFQPFTEEKAEENLPLYSAPQYIPVNFVDKCKAEHEVATILGYILTYCRKNSNS